MNHPEKQRFNYPVSAPGDKCSSCRKRKPELYYHGYADAGAGLFLCPPCAHQLARKLLEDLCDLDGNRYG